MHVNAVWQSLYVFATKNCCALLTFTDNFAPLAWLQYFDRCTFCYLLFGWRTALDVRGRRLVHLPSAQSWQQHCV